MCLLGDCICTSFLERIDPIGVLLLLQLIGLIYLAFSFRRIAHNQVELAEYLKKKLGKDD